MLLERASQFSNILENPVGKIQAGFYLRERDTVHMYVHLLAIVERMQGGRLIQQ